MYNYNVSGLNNVDAGRALLQGQAIRNRRDESERKRRQDEQQAEMQRLTEFAMMQASKDPNFDFNTSNVGSKLAGLDIDLWKKVDDATGKIPEGRKRAYFESSLENYLHARGDRWDMIKDNLTERDGLLGQIPNVNANDTKQMLSLIENEEYEKARNLLEANVATGVATKYIDFVNPYDWESWQPYVDDEGKMRVAQANKLGDTKSAEVSGAGSVNNLRKGSGAGVRPDVRLGEVYQAEDGKYYRNAYDMNQNGRIVNTIATGRVDKDNNIDNTPIDYSKEQYKRIDEFSNAADSAMSLSNRAGTLADQIRNNIVGSGIVSEDGIFSRIEGNLRGIFGEQTDKEFVRKEIKRVINTNIVNDLPAGIASDRDVALIQAGFPEAYDNPELLAEWFDLLSRVKLYESMKSGIRADFTEITGGFRNAPREAVINGIKVPKNSTLADYEKKVFTEYERLQKEAEKERDPQGLGI